LAYQTDSLYFAKNTLLYALIYGIYVLFIWLVILANKKILLYYYKREQTIAELKLKSIRNQLDPHFTFNAINAIAAAIYKEEKETAYEYFSIFSKLIRSTMLYSDRLSRMLEEEIDFTVKYLKIEKFRYRNKFEYSVSLDKDLNLIREVPRMILQTFAETAITNSLMHRKENGKLEINIREEGGEIVATFIDNGVGIENSKKLNKEKAYKSLKVMDEFLQIFNDLRKTKISYSISEINPNIEFPGTKAVVYIPLKIQLKDEF